MTSERSASLGVLFSASIRDDAAPSPVAMPKFQTGRDVEALR
jgi:hypothetical protein